MDLINHQLLFSLVLTMVFGLEIKREIKKSCSVMTDKGDIDLTSVAKTDNQNAA